MSDPADFPRALSNRGLQYSFSRAPARGMIELLDSYRRSAWLQAVVNRIGYHFAIVPWQLYERPQRSKMGARLHIKRYRRLPAEYLHKTIGSAVRLGELQEIDSHPLLDLLDFPNPEMGSVAFRDMCCKFIDFTGECFQLVVRDALGIPFQLWPLAPTWVTRIPTTDEPTFDFSVLGVNMQIPRESVIYMRRAELLNPYGRGTGIGVSLDDTVDIDDYAHKFLKGFYFNGARPDMIISLPGASEEVIADFQMKFENQTRGAARAHRTFFADEEIKLDELKNDAGAEQSLPILNYVRDTFISVFGVPPEIMGVLENSNRATVNQAMTIFARETLMPRLELFKSEWLRQLVPMFDENLLLSYVNPVPEDDDFRLDVAKAAPWSLSVREWRQLGGWGSADGQFNYYMIPMGLNATDDPATPILAPGQPSIGGTPGAAPAEPAPEAAPAAPAKAAAYENRKSFNEDDHPRDDAGRWTDGGGSPLTADQAVALETYQGRTYKDMQATLRNNAPGLTAEYQQEMRDKAAHLNAAIESTSLASDTVVYRGINVYPSSPLHDVKAGAEFTDAGFVSTSQSKDVAVEFAKRSSQGAQKIVFEISLPKGTHGLDVTQHVHSENASKEQELILGTGTRFRVTSVGKLDGVRGVKHVKLEIY